MNWLLDPFFGRLIGRETERQVQKLKRLPEITSRKKAAELLDRLRKFSGPNVTLGETSWGEPVIVPLEFITNAYGLVTGGTGSGKTVFALLILQALIERTGKGKPLGFDVLDAKGDLFTGALYLVQKHLEYLADHNPQAARELRRRIVICDFSSRDPITAYNILARWPNTEPEFFAFSRADLLLDLLGGGDKLSLSGVALLQKLLGLLSEFGLPITYVTEVLQDEQLRMRLVAECRNSSISRYFVRQFSGVPKPTIAALHRRMEGLFASEGVRFSLSGETAPDFRRLQDEGKIVLINCFGETIPRSVRRLLQGLVLSDIRQSVFARRQKESKFVWFCDEAQNFFLTEKLRDNMADLLTMSRSFGSFCTFLTQNMTTAVQDTRMLRILHTNLRWAFSMRGEPSDCEFLKAVLPVTGRKPCPQPNPFEEKRFYSLSEERTMALNAIANLPDRIGYLWFKHLSAEALKIETQELTLPQGRELEAATRTVRNDPSIGGRMSRRVYLRTIEERNRKWDEEQESVDLRLEQTYQRLHGEEQ